MYNTSNTSPTLLHHYYMLNSDPRAGELFEFISQHKLRFEVHLNRTGFWVPSGSVFTEFALRFMDSCTHYVPTLDAGLPDYEC